MISDSILYKLYEIGTDNFLFSFYNPLKICILILEFLTNLEKKSINHKFNI